MRCLYAKSEILVLAGRTAEGAAIMEEMLELNEHDNQGVRFPLQSALIMLGETKKFKKYDKLFNDNYSAQTLYSRALFAFKTEGNSDNARKMLEEAFEKNPFVVQKLIDDDFQINDVESYTLGSPEEAKIYLMHALIAWYQTEGAMEWLVDTIKKTL